MATTLLYGGLTAVVCLPWDKKRAFLNMENMKNII